MTPFADYPLMCPKCGSGRVYGEGSRGERFWYTCQDCGQESESRTTFKKERVLKMKRWQKKVKK